MTSTDYSDEKVNLTYGHWEDKLKLTEKERKTANNNGDWYDIKQTKKSKLAIQYKYHNENTEWEFFAFKVEETMLEDRVAEKNYSTIVIKFGFQRNSPYYTMTLIIPILVLTLLAPLGLILPGKANYKSFYSFK